MSRILSIDGEDGFSVCIKTDIGEIRWNYESTSRCCERFGVEMSQPLSWLIDRKFENISLDVEEGNRAILTLKLEELGTVNIREQLKSFLDERKEVSPKDLNQFADLTDNKWTIEFYNYHNGYYSHNLDVVIDGTRKWNLSL